MRTVPLGEVADIERNGVDPSELPPETLYLGLEHIERGGRIIGRDTVAAANLASTKFRFSSEHVLFGKLRPNLGKIGRPDFEGVCSTDILPIRPGKHLDRNYLAHYLAQPNMIDFAASRTSGANLPRLSPNVLKEFPVPLPPLSEQRRIAAILDQADALRVKRRLVLEKLASLTKSVFQTMFDAENRTLIEFGSVIAEGPANGLYRPANDYGTGTPILRIDSFSAGRVVQPNLKRVRISGEEVSRYGLAVGDIVVNRVNALSHLGKSALIESLPEPTVYESNMMRIRVDGSKASPRFVIAWLQTESVKRQVLARAKKAINQASINQGDVRTLLMPSASLAKQEEFAACAAAVDARRVTVEVGLRKTDELFASLQSRAFRGELCYAG